MNLRQWCTDENWLGFHNTLGHHSAFRYPPDNDLIVVSFGGNPEAKPSLSLESRKDFNNVLRSIGKPELPE